MVVCPWRAPLGTSGRRQNYHGRLLLCLTAKGQGPDLAPTNYHLVPDMQRVLEGTDFKKNRHTVDDKEVKYY
uniref:Uncharacterized protein n=1 Tax=Caenorhabditis japonica TaxID=281687 RepID=A0A8R1ED67_CAEJA